MEEVNSSTVPSVKSLAAFSLAVLMYLPPLAAQNAQNKIMVFMIFEGHRSEEVVRAMQNELVSVMKPSGLDFAWRMSDAETPFPPTAKLAIVTFSGDCEYPRQVSPLRLYQGLALGSTHMNDGVVSSFATLDCSGIRQFVAKGINGYTSCKERERLLGRAMGRVLAHEMYHILARNAAHAKSGLAKKELTSYELLVTHAEFSKKEYALLSYSMLPQALASASESKQAGPGKKPGRVTRSAFLPDPLPD